MTRQQLVREGMIRCGYGSPDMSADWGQRLDELADCPRYPVTVPQPAIEEQLVSLTHLILHQQQQITALAAEMARLKDSSRLSVRLSSLGISGYTVQKPIPVTIRPDGDEFVATFFDANISTGGETEQEAVANLQTLIADFYDDLAAIPNEKLSTSSRRQKLVLVEFLCRT